MLWILISSIIAGWRFGRSAEQRYKNEHLPKEKVIARKYMYTFVGFSLLGGVFLLYILLFKIFPQLDNFLDFYVFSIVEKVDPSFRSYNSFLNPHITLVIGVLTYFLGVILFLKSKKEAFLLTAALIVLEVGESAFIYNFIGIDSAYRGLGTGLVVFFEFIVALPILLALAIYSLYKVISNKKVFLITPKSGRK
jgi:hypothetical protein